MTTAHQIGFGLMGSELVRLAAAGKITIAAGRVDVTDQSPGLDPFLDAALASLDGSRRGVRAKAWVSHPRRGITEAYLERLAAAGVLQAERGTRLGIFSVTRWRVTDAGRQAQARARLDAVALTAGPVSTAQAALGGLAHAAGLGAVLYPGRANRQARTRLERSQGQRRGGGRGGRGEWRRRRSQPGDGRGEPDRGGSRHGRGHRGRDAGRHRRRHQRGRRGRHGCGELGGARGPRRKWRARRPLIPAGPLPHSKALARLCLQSWPS